MHVYVTVLCAHPLSALRLLPKTKRLTVRELRNIAKELKNINLGVVQEVVVREVQKEQHVHFSPRVPLLGMSLLLLAALTRLS